MCGILATISSEPSKVNKEVFSSALGKIKHRGPDGSRIEQVGKNGLLGFNWLSIQDLNVEAMQPFEYEGNHLIFNGEIYNFIELRNELENAGKSFTTVSDTEVLAVGLSLYGLDFIKKLNGIYAFIFYESKKREYWVVRDKFGVKPLFYSQNNERLIISSEVKAILEYEKPILNPTILYTQLYMDWFVGNQNDKSYFKNIKSVEPGTYYVFDEIGKQIKKEQYCVVNLTTTINKPLAEIETEFGELLAHSLEIESRSDVPIGIILSGGIDSTTILTLVTPYLLKKQKRISTFTYYYKDRGEDADLQYAKKLIKVLQEKYGDVFDMHEINMDPTITFNDYLEAARAHETPVLDIRYITRLKNYRAVQDEKLKVVFNGQGSDEVYYGYYPLDYWLSVFYRQGIFDTNNIINYFAELNKIKLSGVNDQFLQEAIEETKNYLDNFFIKYGKQENQQKLFTAFLRQNMLPALIGAEDRFGMAAGIEVRVPTINPLMVEYADQIDYKIHLTSTTSGRYLFRAALKNILPEDLVLRPKNPGPKKKNYQKELLAIIKEQNGNIQSSPLVNFVYKKEFVEKLIQQAESLKDDQFYGGVNDVLSEIIGLYAFEKVFGVVI